MLLPELGVRSHLSQALDRNGYKPKYKPSIGYEGSQCQCLGISGEFTRFSKCSLSCRAEFRVEVEWAAIHRDRLENVTLSLGRSRGSRGYV